MALVHKMYKQYACPLVRIVQGLPTLWEPVVATLYNGEFVLILDDVGVVAAWSFCNRFIAISEVGAVKIHDAATLDLLATLISPFGKIQALFFSPDGRFLIGFESSEKKRLATWDL